MALNLYRDVYASDSVPQGWTPRRGAAVKYPVRNRAVLRELRRLRSGQWQKVIKHGNIGEVHYFKHGSGRVAGVKLFLSR
jgi:hypothetical protein